MDTTLIFKIKSKKMLDEIYNIDDSLSEDEYYDSLIYFLGDIYPDLSEEELEEELEELLDQMPDQFAENVLNTLGNVGKKIGSGALKFASNNPGLVKGVLTTAGTLVGGPVGAKIGGGLGNFITQVGQNKTMPETGKMLAMMQNPQVQTAVARASMGMGNGTAPFSMNGNTTQIPAALYLRAMINVAQSALKELDKNNVISPAQFSESLPFADDIDLQAEWLIENLVSNQDQDAPFKGCKVQFPLRTLNVPNQISNAIVNLENFILQNPSLFLRDNVNNLPIISIRAYDVDRANTILNIFTTLIPTTIIVNDQTAGITDNYGFSRVAICFPFDPSTTWTRRQRNRYNRIIQTFIIYVSR